MSGANVDSNGWRCEAVGDGWVYTSGQIRLTLRMGRVRWLASAGHYTSLRNLGKGYAASPREALRRALEAFAPVNAPFKNRQAWEEGRRALGALPIAGGPLDAEGQEGAA
jgi:hypothetical protein